MQPMQNGPGSFLHAVVVPGRDWKKAGRRVGGAAAPATAVGLPPQAPSPIAIPPRGPAAKKKEHRIAQGPKVPWATGNLRGFAGGPGIPARKRGHQIRTVAAYSSSVKTTGGRLKAPPSKNKLLDSLQAYSRGLINSEEVHPRARFFCRSFEDAARRGRPADRSQK